jgi:acyl-CoA thioesterase FadM
MIKVILHLFINFFKSPKKIALHKKESYHLFVMPWHLDLNLHMNNATYLHLCNQARLVYISKHGVVNLLLKEKLTPVITKMDISYHKSLRIFQRFIIESELISVEPGGLFLKHTFSRREKIYCTIKCHIKFLSKKEKINHLTLFQKYLHD